VYTFCNFNRRNPRILTTSFESYWNPIIITYPGSPMLMLILRKIYKREELLITERHSTDINHPLYLYLRQISFKMLKTIITTTSVFLIASLVASTPVAKLDDTVTERNQAVLNEACGIHVKEGKGPHWPIEVEVFAPETEEKHKLIATGSGNAKYGNIDIDIGRNPGGHNWVLVITKASRTADGDDTLWFGFGNDVWTTNSRCSVGGYDAGWRQMDCSFSC
jgi:hypothetical protein